MTYEHFREVIRSTLSKAGYGLTWTEIRTTAALPQMFPNNQWVRRMEQDIGLLRIKDGNGIMHWTLKT